MPVRYSTAQIVLHWLIAALILVQFLTGDAMSGAFERQLEGGGGALDAGANLHRLLGIAVLLLAVLRFGLRLSQGAPGPTPQSPGWDVTVSKWAHAGLYMLIIVTPGFGLAAYMTGSETLGEAHEIAKTLLMLLIFAHIAGALYHQFVLRDGLLRRMIFRA